MTLCDNGLLTYHPSLHVSLGGRPWGRPGPGDRGSVGRPGSGTLVSSNGRSLELRKDLAWVAWELFSPQGRGPGPNAYAVAPSCGLSPSEESPRGWPARLGRCERWLQLTF